MSSVRRLFATLMLVLFLLNVLGYYGIMEGFKAKSTIEWASQAGDAEQGIGEQVTFKIPLTVPYGTDSREYQTINGHFEFGGEVYQLVKQKLLRDTLYVVGVKDETSSMWGRAIADYVMTFSDTADDSVPQSTTVQTGFIKDFISASISVNRGSDGWTNVFVPASRAPQFIDSFFVSFVHPPERA
jgi:hypothetical protein